MHSVHFVRVLEWFSMAFVSCYGVLPLCIGDCLNFAMSVISCLAEAIQLRVRCC